MCAECVRVCLSVRGCGSQTHAKHLPRALEHINHTLPRVLRFKKKRLTGGPTDHRRTNPLIDLQFDNYDNDDDYDDYDDNDEAHDL